MHVRTRSLLPLGHDVGKLRRSAPLALEAGDALVDAQAQLDEITARRTGLFQHDGKERVPGVGHGMAARAGAHDIADEGGRAVIQHQTGHQPVAVPGVEQAHIGAFGGQHLRRAGKELAHVGPQHGPAHELGPQAAVLRTELARLVDAQAFPGLAHGRTQTRRHGRIGRKRVELVPLQHVVRQTRRQVGAHGKAGRGPGLAQGPGQGGLETLVAVLAAIPQGVGDGHEPVFGGVERRSYPPSSTRPPETACMKGAECSGTTARARMSVTGFMTRPHCWSAERMLFASFRRIAALTAGRNAESSPTGGAFRSQSIVRSKSGLSEKNIYWYSVVYLLIFLRGRHAEYLQCSLSEEETKLRYITPALENAGWEQKRIRMELYFTDGRVQVHGGKAKRATGKKADYLLFWSSNQPLAIVEAKEYDTMTGDGMDQALDYAQTLDVPFAYTSNGKNFLEHDLLTGKERTLSMEEFPSPEDLWQRFRQARAYTPEEEELIQQPYYFADNVNTPRYYQRIAINRTVEAVARGQQRILLVMATGTGKTYTAFQIIHRLWKSGRKKRILFLADRNVLVDQTMSQDFAPFGDKMHKVEHKKLDSSYEIYLSLYQQLAGDENEEPFRAFAPTFFDLIIVDECHRGSARENSRWRKILDYFHTATHIGMTATPKETEDISNSDYFGEPIYTYSLKQGIDDGFLAPYTVVRVELDKDLEGWRPEAGKLDVYGNEVEDCEYTVTDFDRNLIIDERTTTVAHHISQYLKKRDPFAKTIVFCAR